MANPCREYALDRVFYYRVKVSEGGQVVHLRHVLPDKDGGCVVDFRPRKSSGPFTVQVQAVDGCGTGLWQSHPQTRPTLPGDRLRVEVGSPFALT